MDIYDVRKEDKQWMFRKEDSASAIKTFETKKQAVQFSREYLKNHGGTLRIWKSDGTSLQEERTYEVEGRSFYSGILEGVSDAAEAAGRFLPSAGDFLSKGIYEAGYYAAYGLVFGATAVARLVPWPDALTHGVQDGTQAALGTAAGAQHPDKTAPAAG